MNKIALSLVLLSVFFNLTWNVLVKKANDKLAFLWMALVPSCFIACGALVWEIVALDTFPKKYFLFMFAGAVVHALFTYLLSSAYHRENLSVVYPFSRGLGTMLATMLGVLLFSESPSNGGWIGIGIILTILSLDVLLNTNVTNALRRKGLLMSGLTGVAVAIYLLVDKYCLTYMPLISYLAGTWIGTTVFLFPAAFKGGRIEKEFRNTRFLPFYTSVVMLLAIGSLFAALKLAPLSYVAPARASGIIASGLAGTLFLKERLTPFRWFVIFGIAIGLFLIGLA